MEYYDHVPLEVVVTLWEVWTLNYRCLKIVAFFMEDQEL